MSEFTTSKTHKIAHKDGWGYVVQEYFSDELGAPAIEMYATSDVDEIGDKAEFITSIWPEAARLIAQALIELADQMESKSKEISP